jgi:hypothetical protein
MFTYYSLICNMLHLRNIANNCNAKTQHSPIYCVHVIVLSMKLLNI